MSPFGDYKGDMGSIGDLSDREIEILLSGSIPPGREDLADLAADVQRVKKKLSIPPTPASRQDHLAAIVRATPTDNGEPVVRPVSKAAGSALQTSGLPKWRMTMDRARPFAMKLGAGVLAASMSTVGLAYAGVKLPEQATNAFASVGFHLPNQPAGDKTKSLESGDRALNADDTQSTGDTDSSHGREVSDLATSGPGGCAFGQNVSALARSKNKAADSAKGAGDSRPDPCDRADSNSKGSKPTWAGGPGYGKDNHPGKNDHPGKDNHPDKDNHPGNNDQPSSDSHPGKDNHPDKDNHPGEDNHPGNNDQPSSDSHPGKDNHPDKDNHPGGSDAGDNGSASQAGDGSSASGGPHGDAPGSSGKDSHVPGTSGAGGSDSGDTAGAGSIDGQETAGGPPAQSHSAR